ncbi:MAG: B12-binding domain-containing radical SAM protein [Candidatus Methylomirabilis sp.]|nr:B12-binding domain-containing radical SAM protein [Deltaproteobacteria bacterium]
MRVLLINPKPLYYDEIAQKCFPPLNLLYLAATLREGGHTVRLLDPNGLRLSDEETARIAREWAPDLVGVSLFSDILREVHDFLRFLRPRLPGAKFVIGGPHVSSLYRRVMEEFEEVDFAIREEAEFTLVQLADALERGTGLDDVGGLVRREAGALVERPLGEPIEDLGEIPLPARDLIDEAYGKGAYYTLLVKERPLDVMITSRGCPFKCGFCHNVNWSYRHRKIDDILSELHLIRSRGIRHVEICDVTFTVHRDRALAVLEAIARANLGMALRIKSRAADVDRELMRLARAAGVYQIAFGMESAAPAVLRRMNKEMEVTDYARALRLCAEFGLAAHTGWILGYPGETPETIGQTLDFIAAYKPTTANIFLLKPYPETQVYRDALAEGTLAQDWTVGMKEFPWIRLPWARERRVLEDAVRRAQRRIYFRPHYAWSLGSRALRDVNALMVRYAFQEFAKVARRGPVRSWNA